MSILFIKIKYINIFSLYLNILTTHPTIKDRILEWKWKHHLSRLGNYQSDTVALFGKSSLFKLSTYTKKHLQSIGILSILWPGSKVLHDKRNSGYSNASYLLSTTHKSCSEFKLKNFLFQKQKSILPYSNKIFYIGELIDTFFSPSYISIIDFQYILFYHSILNIDI